MEKKRKVGFATKLLSNHYYMNEVPVEGKTNFLFKGYNMDRLNILTGKLTYGKSNSWQLCWQYGGNLK